MLRVHVCKALEPEERATLEAALPAGSVLTAGPEEQGDAYRVLIGGRPSREDLERSPALEVVLIPFAGLPRETGELLADFPQLAVHNLHHNAAATAEGALGLLLAAARRLVVADQALRQGDWRIRYEACGSPILAGKTALVLGYGAIGQRVARALAALDVEVLAVRRRVRPDDPPHVHPVAELDALLPRAQVVIVCLPETAETRGLLDARRLGLLPQGALLVNVGRGPVIDEEALFNALRDGHLGGAGIDVWYRYPKSPQPVGGEPEQFTCSGEGASERPPETKREDERQGTLPSAFPFHELETVVLSPHRAAHGDVNEDLRWRAVGELLQRLASGQPLPHRVDLAAGY